MILLILLLALIVWSTAGAIVELRRDGYRPVPTDWSRVADLDPLQRAEPGTSYR